MNLYGVAPADEVDANRAYFDFLLLSEVAFLMEEFTKIDLFTFLLHGDALKKVPELCFTDEEVVYFCAADDEVSFRISVGHWKGLQRTKPTSVTLATLFDESVFAVIFATQKKCKKAYRISSASISSPKTVSIPYSHRISSCFSSRFLRTGNPLKLLPLMAFRR